MASLGCNIESRSSRDHADRMMRFRDWLALFLPREARVFGCEASD